MSDAAERLLFDVSRLIMNRCDACAGRNLVGDHQLGRIISLVAVAFALVFATAEGVVAREQKAPRKRARPPQWTADVLDVFFDDVRQELVGSRPEYNRALTEAAELGQNQTTAADSGANGTAWSILIDAETLETEIKRLADAVTKAVTTPSEFKGGTYNECRRHFSVLAVLFAIIAQYDAEVRWQDAAPALRDLFARAGYNCKVGTDQTFQEASRRKQDLVELVRGARPPLQKTEAAATWKQVAERPPLMQRLEIAHEERLTKWLAAERQFKDHRDDIRHEAQIVAAIAEVISREGFDYWDEEDYARYVGELRDAASDVASAVEQNDYGRARQAISRATKACASCHEMYRG